MQCVAPEVSQNICDIRERLIELNHGQPRAEEINGNAATAQLTVVCTMPFTVPVMSAERSGELYFNGGKQFRSELKINGVDIGTGLVVKTNSAGTPLTLNSTLAGYDGNVGQFQGSKSIIVSLP